jgi:hypothetical protein
MRNQYTAVNCPIRQLPMISARGGLLIENNSKRFLISDKLQQAHAVSQ